VGAEGTNGIAVVLGTAVIDEEGGSTADLDSSGHVLAEGHSVGADFEDISW